MTADDPATWDKETAEARLSSTVYAATIKIFQDLERAGKIFGNGHHAAQKVASAATSDLRDRWKDA